MPARDRLRPETKRAAPAKAQRAIVAGSGTGDSEELINWAPKEAADSVEFCDARACTIAWAAAGLNVAVGLTIIAQFATLASMKLPVWS